MNKELKLGAILSYISIALTTVVGLLYTPFMLRQLGPSEYGLYMLIGSLVGYISILDFGLHGTINRFVAKYQAEGDTKGQENFLAIAFMIYGVISFLVLLVGTVLFLNLGSIFSKSLTVDELYKAQIMFAILIFNLTLSLPIGAFQFIAKGYGKFVFVTTTSIIKIILRTVMVVSVLLLGYKSIAIVIVDTVFNILAGLIYALYCFVILKTRIRLHTFKREAVKEIFNFSIFVFILAIVNQLFWKIGQVTLGIVSSTIAVAVYALSINLVIYYQQIALAISGLFVPRVSKLVAQEASEDELTDLMIKVGRVQLALLGLILVGFIILGKQFILLWAGDGYEQVYWIALMIFLPLTVPMIQTVGETILKAKNMISFQALAYLLMSGINFLVSLYLSKAMGSLGVGIATALSLIIFQVLIINIYYKYKVKLNVVRFFNQVAKGLLPAIFITLILGYATLLVPGDSWITLLVRGSMVVTIYAIIMFSFGFNKNEKKLFLEPILNLFRK
ncbi:oligosaccharide flippase family protein [Bacillus thermotolerans]|uniref:O-antigen flippase Wzx n=1 Tax=Bacillus thermotolerans TaxID=1221996 RepID=A0A0F5I608_BACTR|nr:oligosaccharide flippase family protein [Bacillus thermotolerans]KKB40903.1 O-antigen flippase Wzx [Bacillus thermotolerans]